jgi:translocation protein SEC66
MQAELDADKTWWENKRAGMQEQFMAELEGDEEDAKAAIEGGTGGSKGVPKGASEDDAVIVEAGGPAQSQGGGAGGKKKGKK